ncbi:MAG: polysaccharide deacetylase family protein [Schwartzia sp.]|nr:polysaccharide deacetylase family protein [Schwartzia sp. (in: firmicutes)]
MRALKIRLVIAILLIAVAVLACLLFEPPGIPVLNYHQINNRDVNPLTLTTEEFAAEMDFLKNAGYTTITADELADALENGAPLPEKPVLITFDDGYIDNYENAYPILKERGMKAMIFLISDYVGQYPNYLTWEQARTMQKDGISFGSHTLSHAVLTQCTPAEVKKQLAESRRAIEWRLGQPVRFLAYPCGFTTGVIEEQVRDAGYRAAFTVDLGYILPGDDLYRLHRVPAFGANTHMLLRFQARLRCPRIAASLENFQRALMDAGYPKLAEWVPSF